MKTRALFKFGVGELPAPVPANDGFSVARWAKAHPAELNNHSHSSHRGYRMRHAARLLAKIKSGALAPSAVAGIERDYKRELAKLRKGAK